MAPVAGLILADLGAEVVKVEPAETGDPTRSLKGFASGFFPHFNRNKRSIGIDLKRQEGVDLAHRLVETADIVIENYAPGTMERLGCGGASCASSIRGSFTVRSRAFLMVLIRTGRPLMRLCSSWVLLPT